MVITGQEALGTPSSASVSCDLAGTVMGVGGAKPWTTLKFETEQSAPALAMVTAMDLTTTGWAFLLVRTRSSCCGWPPGSDHCGALPEIV